MYLRVLEQIDNEVVDRTFESLKTTAQQQHATNLKDEMRITDVPIIVKNVKNILQSNVSKSVKNKGLSVLSNYISWIDIDLILLDNNLSEFLLTCLNDHDIRENCVKVFIAMVEKGMLPSVERSFTETLYSTLESKFSPLTINPDTKESNVNYLVQIANFYSAILTTLSEAYTASNLQQILTDLDNVFVPCTIQLLANEWNDVGEAIILGIKNYLEICKKRQVEDLNESMFGDLLQAIIKKMRYDDDYDFEDVDEADESGEEESHDEFGDDEVDDWSFLDDDDTAFELIFEDFNIYSHCWFRKSCTGNHLHPWSSSHKCFHQQLNNGY
jgi:hypothetical protein